MQILRKTEEIIYPSSDAHPTLFRLSETDQLRYAISSLYFYMQGPASAAALKSSLSKTLTVFYPLAGRLVPRTEETAYTCPDLIRQEGGIVEAKGTCTATANGGEDCEGTRQLAMGGTRERRVAIGGRMDVSCLDQGALFCEAWTDASLGAYEPDFQPHPDFARFIVSSHDDFLLRVQVTHFACGGVCLCVKVHHCLFDGTSNAHFMKLWVEVTNGAENPSMLPCVSHPPLEIMYGQEDFQGLSMDDYSSYYESLPSYPTLEVSNRIFHFTPHFIDNLKHVASSGGNKYSTFECITAFIWKALTIARGIALDEEVCLYYPVNGRGKFVPPLPPSYLGNVVFRTHASVKVSELVEKPLSHITHLLREATSKVTNTHMRAVLEWSKRQSLPMSNREYLSPHTFVNLWTSFPVLDLNFGWGSPSSLRTRFVPYEFVLIMSSSQGRRYVEVLVALNKDHMKKLDSLLS